MTKIEAKRAVSPADLLKAVVTGKPEAQPASPPKDEAAAPKVALAKRLTFPSLPQLDPRRLAVPGAALAVGALLGGGVIAMTRSPGVPNDTVMALSTTLDAGRTETARLASDIAQLHAVLADLRASTDTSRKEAANRSGVLGERLAQLDKSLNAKTTALGERFEQIEREQNARIASLTAQLDRRAAAPAAAAAKAEPTQTGSIAEAPRSADAKAAEPKVTEAKLADAKPVEPKMKTAAPEKPPVIDAWALRDVYDGTAILENRRRRLVEVAPGDMLPGVGRVEGVERHGREWVVVTRQGLVTPQPW
jgi:uncharacterized low-complexity protein